MLLPTSPHLQLALQLERPISGAMTAPSLEEVPLVKQNTHTHTHTHTCTSAILIGSARECASQLYCTHWRLYTILYHFVRSLKNNRMYLIVSCNYKTHDVYIIHAAAKPAIVSGHSLYTVQHTVHIRKHVYTCIIAHTFSALTLSQPSSVLETTHPQDIYWRPCIPPHQGISTPTYPKHGQLPQMV